MFLPKSKYKGPFTATGGDEELLVKSTLKPYRGEYIITYKNQYFNGATPQEAKYELILKKVHLEKEDRIDLQGMKIKNFLVLKKKKVFLKIIKQVSQVLETNQIHLKKEDQINLQGIKRKKFLLLKEKKVFLKRMYLNQ